MLTCYQCGRHRPPCGFTPMMWMGGTWVNDDGSVSKVGGQLCWDCDEWMRGGSPSRIAPTEEGPINHEVLAVRGLYDG